MELKPFLPEDGKLFLQYQSHSTLAHSGFQPHLIWSDLLEYRWVILEEMFCLFATAHGITHLALPPFGPGSIEQATALAFERITRIDNVDETSALLLSKAGYQIKPTAPDYLYRREEIVNLSGRRFHAQRGACNQASRLIPTLRPFTPSDTAGCLALFCQWEDNPILGPNGSLNRMMREDARFAHHAAMKGYRELGLTGRVVEVENTIVGYTFGFPLSRDTFCVLLEITNHSQRSDRPIRGLSAWLFRTFCSELSTYTFINSMDDSGLAGLSHAKALWHPVRMIPAYTVTLA